MPVPSAPYKPWPYCGDTGPVFPKLPAPDGDELCHTPAALTLVPIGQEAVLASELLWM
jgi:hypothetical protein